MQRNTRGHLAPSGSDTNRRAVAPPVDRTVLATLLATVIATVLLATGAPAMAQERPAEPAAIRFAYLMPGGPNLDVRLEGSVLHPGLIAQTVSGYFIVESGDRAFDVTPVAGTFVPGDQATPDVSEEQIATRVELNLEPGTYTTLLIAGTLGEALPPAEGATEDTGPALPPQIAFETRAIADRLDGLPPAGEARVRAVSASLDTPPLEVALQVQDASAGQEAPEETVLATGLAFGDSGNYEPLAGALYRVVIRTENEVTADLPDLTLDSGVLYTVYVTQGGSIVAVSVDAGVTLETP